MNTLALPADDLASLLPVTVAHEDPPIPTDMRPLLAPRTVAVIGAARRANSIGHEILQNFVTHRFAGAVYPVNPRASSIGAIRAYPTIDAIPDPVDLAIIVVHKEQVVDVAEECGRAGVKGVIVISAGFREVGPQGATREDALTRVVRRHGMRLVGPNCMGIINADPAVSMNATFANAMPAFGPCGFVSQSGALGLAVLDYAREYGIGISQFVSIGNTADVSGNDLLMHWENDPATKVILMYVETVRDPPRFLELASRISKTKPIVVLKAGRSRAGARAASSHTGALAASDTAVGTLLAQAGVLRAGSLEELFEIAMSFSVHALPRSRRTAVLTNAGGPGILSADALEQSGLTLVEPCAVTVEALRPFLPAEASIRNPVDMLASATPATYKAAMVALLADPAVDAVVPIFVPPFGVKQEEVAKAIRDAAAQSDKPVLATLMGVDGLAEARGDLNQAGVPAYIFPESAVRALASLNLQAEWSRRPPARPERLEVRRDAAAAILATAREQSRERLTEIESLRLLSAYHIPVAEAHVAIGPEGVLHAAAEIGYPLVMKIVSPDVTHKSDVGGVRLGIASDAEARAAYSDLVQRVHERSPKARVTGVLLQRMVTGGREMITGVARDPAFGPLVMFGLGGIFVEALADVVFGIAPLDATQALDLVHGIRAAKLLSAVRGQAAADTDALATVIRRIGQLAVDFPEIRELDVNPLLAFGSGTIAIDARVRIAI